jgi:hypothetical protein
VYTLSCVRVVAFLWGPGCDSSLRLRVARRCAVFGLSEVYYFPVVRYCDWNSLFLGGCPYAEGRCQSPASPFYCRDMVVVYSPTQSMKYLAVDL